MRANYKLYTLVARVLTPEQRIKLDSCSRYGFETAAAFYRFCISHNQNIQFISYIHTMFLERRIQFKNLRDENTYSNCNRTN